MARPVSRARDLGLVLAGGALGGALRIVLTETLPHGAGPVPWDLIAINVVGSLGLAWAVARTQARGPWRAFPMLGPGFFGGFTTFSSIAALEWSAGTSPELAVTVLGGTIAAAVAGALLGWWLGDRPPTPLDEAAVFEEENE
ncbi:fluoride efflux transporter FluC [Demequina phytophila]|uniref:fluoride efflux transporter FluC n=1 Tax=Demequina phytophila TaxID=1638981 RepID=UPI000782D42B|nr:CrcB family protein [Demequina phytophila]